MAYVSPPMSHSLLVLVLFLTTILSHYTNFAFVASKCPTTSSAILYATSTATNTPKKKYLATCLPGLSGVVEQELLNNVEGITHIEKSGKSAVEFEGTCCKVGLQALLWTRATLKVCELVSTSTTSDNHNQHVIESRQDVYDFVCNSVDVKSLLGDGKGGLLTLSVHVVFSNPQFIPEDINHSHYTALTIKNALVDTVRELREDGERPSVDVDAADVPLVAVIRGTPRNDGATLSLYRQLHHGSLHKRGHRSNASIHKASMKESMAAGLLLATEKVQDAMSNDCLTIVDPMAGSGSLLLEACSIVGDVAPGLMRIKCGVPGAKDPPVLKWKNEEEGNIRETWKELLLDATARAKKGLQRLRSTNSNKIKLVANEIHPGALDLLEESLYQAGFMDLVEVHQGDCQDFIPTIDADGRVLVVTNPPWGVRLTEDMHESLEALRVFLRENCPPGRTEAWVLSGNKQATKHLGLKRSGQSLVLQTANQDLRWIQYKILDRKRKRGDNDNTFGGDYSTETEDVNGRVVLDERPLPSLKQHHQQRETVEPPTANARQRYTPRQSTSQKQSRGNSSSRGDGYERRKSPVGGSTSNGQRRNRNDKAVVEPMTAAEREERKNSWYI